jgi:cytoskeletal protein RodZ
MLTYFNAYKNIIILSVIGLLILLLAIQSYRLNSYKADLANSNAQTSILSSGIDLQNKAIQKQAEDDAKRAQDSLEALNAAKAIALHRQGKINKLQKTLNTPQSC